MGILQALKARKPTTRAVIAKNKVIWWAQSVRAAVTGRDGPGEKLIRAILGEASAKVETLEAEVAGLRGHVGANSPTSEIGDD